MLLLNLLFDSMIYPNYNLTYRFLDYFSTYSFITLFTKYIYLFYFINSNLDR